MFRLLWLFRWRLACGLALMLLTVVFQLALPKGLAYFIDHLSTPDIAVLNDLAALMLVVVVFQAIAMAGRYYVFESTGYLVVHHVREQLYRSILNKPVAFFDKHHVGELNSRLSSDVETLHDTLTMGLALFLRAGLLFMGALVMMLSISFSLAATLIMLIPVSLFMARWIGRQFRVRSIQKQNALAACGKTAQEYLSHIRLVKAFNQQPYASQRYVGVNQQSLRISLSNTALFAKFQSGSLLLTFGALLLTLWLGAGQISSGKISTGDLTSFVLYAGMLSMSASTLSDFWGEWMRTVGATSEIFGLLEEAIISQSTGQEVVLDGAIQFRNVSFSYPERPLHYALKQLSFNVQPGEKIALVGPSGAGKSTVVALLLGFYQPNQGQILLGSEQVTDLESLAVRQQIAVVEQEPSLFSGSIYENIAFAVSEREVREDEVQRAAKLACADEFICSFPSGYQTQVGEHGMQLSGGQKQRIAIARAILRDPKILILDEATSALDAASEHLVQRALDYLMQNRTTLIIAHRFSTITRADRILVLEQGSLVQEGKPQHLSTQQEGAFYQLMRLQLMQNIGSRADDANVKADIKLRL
nr:ABC transporter transmembrane domain-containing protein [Rheinheimera hassiensis]